MSNKGEFKIGDKVRVNGTPTTKMTQEQRLLMSAYHAEKSKMPKAGDYGIVETKDKGKDHQYTYGVRIGGELCALPGVCLEEDQDGGGRRRRRPKAAKSKRRSKRRSKRESKRRKYRKRKSKIKQTRKQ
jgi:hypothetical protein